MNSNDIKLRFRIQQDETGYPPVTMESLHVSKITQERYCLESIPFFFREATLGDSVVMEEEEDGLYYALVVGGEQIAIRGHSGIAIRGHSELRV